MSRLVRDVEEVQKFLVLHSQHSVPDVATAVISSQFQGLIAKLKKSAVEIADGAALQDLISQRHLV